MKTVNNSVHSANFNAISPFYDLLQKLIFGSKLQQAQSHFLNEIAIGSNVLIVGGGTGKILTDLFQKTKPNKIVFVEQSPRMIEKAKTRILNNKIEFICEDIFEWNSSRKFDVIILPFILDCFSTEQTVQLLESFKLTLQENGQLIFTDFVSSPNKNNLSKLLIPFMYRFFKVTAKLKVNELPDYNFAFENIGFKIVKTKSFVGGMVENRVYQ